MLLCHHIKLTQTPCDSSCRRSQSCWAASPGQTPCTLTCLTSPAAWWCSDIMSLRYLSSKCCVTLLMASIHPIFSPLVAAYTVKLLVLVLMTQPWSTSPSPSPSILTLTSCRGRMCWRLYLRPRTKMEPYTRMSLNRKNCLGLTPVLQDLVSTPSASNTRPL